MNSTRDRESGQAMLLSIIVVVAMTGVVASTLTIVNGAQKETNHDQSLVRALYIAESGVQNAVLDLSGGGTGNLGSESAPISFDGGTFWTQATPQADGTYEVVAEGRLNNHVRRLEAVVEEHANIFKNAIFAGNASGDPDYALEFEGLGGQADQINGDIYSGGDIVFGDDATISGVPRSSGIITGAAGHEGVHQGLPDIPAMHYEINHDVNVSQAFVASETWDSSAAGGSAWQVPSTDPAHIFRKNPSDRGSENSSTVKDDYYLEDPYEPVGVDSSQDGSDPYMITLGSALSSGSKVVYYIDGNLWLHNRPSYSFSIDSPYADGVQVTFVVKGNITFSDNLFYDNPDKDGVAFIAIKDENVEDSGNIYFGDPSGGTLEEMNAFLYAEENFYDINLEASGSRNILLNGTMSAGNHVAIERTFGDSHSQLVVNADGRIADGSLSMPGVPGSSQVLEYRVALWRKISLHSD